MKVLVVGGYLAFASDHRIADDVMVHGGTYTVYLTLQTCGRDRRHVTGQVSCVKCQLGGRR